MSEKDVEYAFLFKELNALFGIFSLDGFISLFYFSIYFDQRKYLSRALPKRSN